MLSVVFDRSRILLLSIKLSPTWKSLQVYQTVPKHSKRYQTSQRFANDKTTPWIEKRRNNTAKLWTLMNRLFFHKIMDNYKFTSLLAQTSLSTAEKYNLTVIFNTLTDNRKLEIIENWRVYYDKILSIHTSAEEEKAENIRVTFAKINNLIDEAILRDEARKRQEAAQEEKQKEEQRSAETYDMQRKLEQLRHIGRPPSG